VAQRHKPELDEAQLVSSLKEIVDRIRSEEDPFELNQYRRLFRKGVPLTLRSYFAAYLLKQLCMGRNPGRFPLVGSASGRSNGRQSEGRATEGRGREGRATEGRGRDRDEARSSEGRQSEGRGREGRANEGRGREESHGREGRATEGRAREERASRQAEPRESREPREPREPRVVFPDDVATTLFFSIGRNRRVYPRDLAALIAQSAGIDRDHIGDVRVLDNYSFVQVLNEDADAVIAALNEQEYRGRKMVVSYSRKREDGAPTPYAARADEKADDEVNAEDDFETSDDITPIEGMLGDEGDSIEDDYGDEGVSETEEDSGDTEL